MSRNPAELRKGTAQKMVPHRALTANGNEAAAIAAQQFQAEACPIRLSRARIPAGQLAERTYEILSDGQAFVALMEAAEELSRQRPWKTCGDWTREAHGRPGVWNVPLHTGTISFESTRRFDFLQTDPETGPILLFAFDPQEVYDMNVIGAKLTRLTQRPVIILSDGETTDQKRMKIEVFANSCAIRALLGPSRSAEGEERGPAAAFSSLGPAASPRDGKSVLHLFDQLLAEFEALTGHRYRMIERHGERRSDTTWVVLNPPVFLMKECAPGFGLDGSSPLVFLPRILNPFPGEDLRRLPDNTRSVTVVERRTPSRISHFVTSQIREALSSGGQSPVVSVRSLVETEAADAPVPGDPAWAFLEALRVSAILPV